MGMANAKRVIRIYKNCKRLENGAKAMMLTTIALLLDNNSIHSKLKGIIDSERIDNNNNNAKWLKHSRI